MNRTFAALVAGAVLMLPMDAAAQGFGIAARAGTLGVGGEAAVQLGSKLGLRAGLGTIPVDYNGSFSDVDYTVKPPKTIANVAVDLYPTGGGFRLTGGLVMKDDIIIEGEYAGENVSYGGRTYSGDQVGTVTGTISQSKTAPYAALGFGRYTSTGFGMVIELGAAFAGEPELEMTADGPLYDNSAQFRSDFEAERQQAEEDLSAFKVWPVLSVGFRIGFGG